MTTLCYRRKLPLWELILGYAALAVGIYTLISSLSGFITIGIGIFLLLQEGSEIDLRQKRYRQTKSILVLNFGRWKPLPAIDYVSVFKTNEVTTLRSRSAEANVSNEIVKLNLFYNTNQKIEAYNTYDTDDAFAKAKDLAKALQIDILDATERPSKWL